MEAADAQVIDAILLEIIRARRGKPADFSAWMREIAFNLSDLSQWAKKAGDEIEHQGLERRRVVAGLLADLAQDLDAG